MWMWGLALHLLWTWARHFNSDLQFPHLENRNHDNNFHILLRGLFWRSQELLVRTVLWNLEDILPWRCVLLSLLEFSECRSMSYWFCAYPLCPNLCTSAQPPYWGNTVNVYWGSLSPDGKPRSVWPTGAWVLLGYVGDISGDVLRVTNLQGSEIIAKGAAIIKRTFRERAKWRLRNPKGGG